MAVGNQYDKLLDPITDITTSAEALLADAFGKMGGDQREGIKTIYTTAWGLHTLFMDIITSLGVENIVRRSYLQSKFHDLTSPIVTISQQLLDELDGPLSDEQVIAVEFINSVGHLLQEHVQALWEYSRLEHNRIKPQPAPFAITNLLDPLTMPVTERDVTLHLLLTDDLPSGYGDFALVQKCVMELIKNAIAFTYHGRITVQAVAVRDQIEIRVQDTGRGIAIENQAKVFDPFYQLYSDGLGLGLYCAKTMMQLQQGDIQLESELDKGSTFTLTIPMVP